MTQCKLYLALSAQFSKVKDDRKIIYKMGLKLHKHSLLL